MQSPIVVMNPAAAKCHLFLTEVYDGIILSTRPNSDHGNGAWLGLSRGLCASGCCDPNIVLAAIAGFFAAGIHLLISTLVAHMNGSQLGS